MPSLGIQRAGPSLDTCDYELIRRCPVFHHFNPYLGRLNEVVTVTFENFDSSNHKTEKGGIKMTVLHNITYLTPAHLLSNIVM